MPACPRGSRDLYLAECSHSIIRAMRSRWVNITRGSVVK
jgi:hypothetical protein